ncbi:MAG: PaaI family thioesterase [Myxococcota bacterium]
MASIPPDPDAAERLTAEARRVVDLVRRTQAPTEVADAALAHLEQATALLAPHAHPGPWAQRSLAWEDGFTSFEPGETLEQYFPYSPLIGPRNPLAPPAEFTVRDGRIHGRVRFGAAYIGPPTCVHGGVIAALFDELLGSVNVANQVGGMTGTLRVIYRSPTPIDTELRLESWVDRTEGRKIFAKGTMHAGEVLTAEAEGIFIQGTIQRFEEMRQRGATAGPASDSPAR